MLVPRLLNVYPEFGKALMAEAIKTNQLDELIAMQDEKIEAMNEFEEWGSSDMACWTWEFANECIHVFNLPFKCVIENHKYEILKNVAV